MAVSAPSLYIFVFAPLPSPSFSVSFSPFIRKTACESCIKGSHVSCILMKWDMRYKRTGRRKRQKEMRCGGGKWPMRKNERSSLMLEKKQTLFHKTRREIKSFSDIPAFLFPSFLANPILPPPSDSTHPPLQSESHFGSSMRRTPRWGLSLMPSTRWHMACITCNGHSAQAIR